MVGAVVFWGSMGGRYHLGKRVVGLMEHLTQIDQNLPSNLLFTCVFTSQNSGKVR